jgi:hypothetical protein
VGDDVVQLAGDAQALLVDAAAGLPFAVGLGPRRPGCVFVEQLAAAPDDLAATSVQVRDRPGP